MDTSKGNPARRTIPAHPFLFALFPIVSLLATNISEVELEVAVGPAGAALAAAALVFLVARAAVRSAEKAALLTSFWLVLFFSYGHAFDSLVDLTAAGGHTRYLPPWLLIGVLVSVAVVRTTRDLQSPTRFLNFFGAVILLLPLINIGQYEWTRNSTLSTRSLQTSQNDKAVTAATTDKYPDIYYLIFDRYSSAPELKRVLAFDNSAFTDRLRRRGFFVADQSRANYPVTYLSLSSSLNLSYHKKARDQKGLEQSLQDSLVRRFLKERGYKYIHYGSAWGPTAYNHFADRNIGYFDSDFDSFSRLFLKTTMARPIIDRFYPPGKEDRDRLIFQLTGLANAPRIEGPKFVFAHVLLPHTPYSFDGRGRPRTAQEQEQIPEIELYKDYIRFANKKIASLIDDIIVKSEQPAIIIIQADEGFRYDTKTDMERYRKPGYMELHYGILNAYYLPGVDAGKVVYDSITPVNTFRAIFNAYFDAGYKLLDDQNYMLITAGKRATGFKRVTARLRK